MLIREGARLALPNTMPYALEITGRDPGTECLGTIVSLGVEEEDVDFRHLTVDYEEAAKLGESIFPGQYFDYSDKDDDDEEVDEDIVARNLAFLDSVAGVILAGKELDAKQGVIKSANVASLYSERAEATIVATFYR